MVSQPKSHSVGGFLNRRFKWRFWVLLPPRAKVPRAGARNIPVEKLLPFYVISAMARATVEAEALFGVGISGSGAVAETVL